MILLVIVYELFSPVSSTIADPIFQHFEWKDKILSNVSKPWMNYVHRKLHDVTKNAEASNHKCFLGNVVKKHFKYVYFQRNEMKHAMFLVLQSLKPG